MCSLESDDGCGLTFLWAQLNCRSHNELNQILKGAFIHSYSQTTLVMLLCFQEIFTFMPPHYICFINISLKEMPYQN